MKEGSQGRKEGRKKERKPKYIRNICCPKLLGNANKYHS